ncbi:protein-disulfide isomerase [Blastomonas natatoria]|uniref:Protein-disulfide isomerase n=1 Tax=Blastomonas natatoria TaxID=34015 RepID=A0A2V3UTI1_9SPHN|nr:DsbA family protein [Blastomonas natatoria]PXW69534.1 protein-disulfide isomerase [Blastomonas natatoria]
MGAAAFVTIAAGIGTLLWQSGATVMPDNAAMQDADKAAAAAGFDTRDKAAIEAIVRAYILDNPEIIPEAIEQLRGKQAAKRIASVRSDIETPYAGAFAGNPDGDVVLAEYSDFACGFCRQSVADVARLIGEDKNLKIVFHELPILSDESRIAANWGMAAAQQGKYYAFYKAMFAAGRPSQATIEQAAKTAGLDMGAARSFVASKQAEQVLDDNIRIAQQLEFSGTPSWVVGNRVLNGAVGYDELKSAITEARSAKKPAG